MVLLHSCFRPVKKKKSLAMFERIAEDQIAAAMRKGEFKNLKGQGKPIKTYRNPHVDPMTARVQGPRAHCNII